MTVLDKIYNYYKKNKAQLAVLIDPEEFSLESLDQFIATLKDSRLNLIFVGGSLVSGNDFEQKIDLLKSKLSIPVIIFPGSFNQVAANADAILFLSLISGRNPDYLIGNQILSAPIIKRLNLETIATAYMLIESGETTSVEFISGTKPIPRKKTDIAMAHAVAAEMLGYKLIYLEAGSGAKQSVPCEMIKAIRKNISIPIIVGGGICSTDEAKNKVAAGASIIVIGNHFQDSEKATTIEAFCRAVQNA